MARGETAALTAVAAAVAIEAALRASLARRTVARLATLAAKTRAGHEVTALVFTEVAFDARLALIERIESDIGPIEVMVFNIGANVPCSLLEETARKYFKIWEMACFSAFLNAREVAKRMVGRQRGTMIFTGATAATRGAANFAACRSITANTSPRFTRSPLSTLISFR